MLPLSLTMDAVHKMLHCYPFDGLRDAERASHLASAERGFSTQSEMALVESALGFGITFNTSFGSLQEELRSKSHIGDGASGVIT